MTSSSIILSNILATESCELKTTIDSYMDTKLKEFQEIMKSKVDSIITDKIDKFYNKSFEEHEKVLFDKDGTQSIDRYNGYVNWTKSNWFQGNNVEKEIKKRFPLYPISKENMKCFTVSFGQQQSSNFLKRELSFFKTFIIQQKLSCNSWTCEIYKHNLSYDCLFAIKHFQVANETFSDSNESYSGHLDASIKVLDEHPEYFKKNCSDFEDICRKEYTEIEKTKSQLKALMDEQISKKNYYANLEKKMKDIELEKKQLEENKIKLKEEKEKMVFIKEKLVQMKEEVELEKQKIEQQKNKTVDLDKCFEEIISSEKSKNKQSTKVAFD
jgi:hypothetical protein